MNQKASVMPHHLHTQLDVRIQIDLMTVYLILENRHLSLLPHNAHGSPNFNTAANTISYDGPLHILAGHS